jgi:hypothetical protein
MVVITDFGLLLACLGAGGIYLLIVSFLWSRLEKRIPIWIDFPDHLLEDDGPYSFIYTYIMELVFYLTIPALVYAWFYSVIPFSGFRGGIAVALIIFVLGMIPVAISILFRVRLPVLFLLYQILGMLFKLAGTLAIIGYLYSL